VTSLSARVVCRRGDKLKKSKLIAAALCMPLYAVAQSNVTVYGLIDMSVNYARFGSTANKPADNFYALSSDASRLGFRGTADLGDGRHAYFKLEAGVSVDTGAQTSATQFWNRESYVGLSDNVLGSVQMGSQYTPAVWSSNKVDPFARFGLGAIVGLLQGSPRGWAVTLNNSVQYISPNLDGLVGRLMAAPGEGSPTGRSYAASLEYAHGPLYLVANQDRTGVTAASAGLSGGPVTAITTSIGATYDFRIVKLAGWYQTNRVANAPHANGYLVGMTLPAGPGEFRATYVRRNLENADASQMAVGYYYFLSGQTMLFGQVGRLDNSGTAAFGLGPSRTEEAAAGLLVAGRDTTGLQLGIRYTF
jgi:predicted porin